MLFKQIDDVLFKNISEQKECVCDDNKIQLCYTCMYRKPFEDVTEAAANYDPIIFRDYVY